MGEDAKKKNANALKYGVMVEGVLTSRGTACVYRDRCEDGHLAQCRPGMPCPAEQATLEFFIGAEGVAYTEARARLGEAIYRQTIVALGILSLQSARLAARIAAVGAVSDGHDLTRDAGISTGRYGTALHNKRVRLYAALFDEAIVQKWLGV